MTTFAAANYTRNYTKAQGIILDWLSKAAPKWELRCKMREFSEQIFFIKEKFKI